MVRHEARGAQGGPGQAAPLSAPSLTPEQAQLLLSAEGRAAVASASALDLDDRLRAAEAVRHLGELGRLALDQALLRRRALAKHPDGDRWWWTAEALEQSTPRAVALHHAARFAGEQPVLDVGCSVGGDLVPLAGVAPTVGVDLDLARLLLARANAQEAGVDVALVQADALTLRPRGLVFADPARRASGRRGFDPRSWSPPLDVVLGWPTTGLGVKVAPGIDHEALPAELEVEVVSLHGDVKEAVLWAGSLRRGSRRTATLLPSRATLASAQAPRPRVHPSGRYVLDPDGAVVRSHLVAELAQQLDGWLLDSTIAYISADAAPPTPFGRWYEVQEVLPFSAKRLKERLRALDAGVLVVKKRGTAVEPEELRRRMDLSGSREVTVVLTRQAGAQVVLVVQPLRLTSKDS